MRSIREWILGAGGVLGLVLGIGPAAAQPAPLAVDAFVETTARAAERRDPDVGVEVARARLGVEGPVRPWLEIEAEADGADGIEMTDVRAEATVLPGLKVEAGRFHTPFSRSALTSSSRTPFVERVRAADALEFGRRRGIAVHVRPVGTGWAWTAGVFDGEAAGSSQFLYVTRGTWTHTTDARTWTLGLNAGTDASRSGVSLRDGLRAGADLHMEGTRTYATAEVLTGLAGTVRSGGAVTVGRHVAPRHTVRGRVDAVQWTAEAAPSAESPTRLGVGYTTRPVDGLRVEVDLFAPTARPIASRLTGLVTVQVDLEAEIWQWE